MTKLLVDLIIPLFNKNILSVVSRGNNHKRKFNKIIIVNDGSTDNVEDVLENYSKNYEFIKVIHQIIEVSFTIARNVGAESFNCRFRVFLDADDN